MINQWIPRWEEEYIKGWLDKTGKGLLLLGARQIGKSSILKRIMTSLSDVVFCNYASPSMLQNHRISLDSLKNEIEYKIESAKGHIVTVIVDEAPRLPAVFDLAQEMMDEQKGKVRFVMTGSSARRLQAGTFNRLPGRIVARELWPVALGEMPDSIQKKLEDHLVFGTLPEVVTDTSIRGELLSSYVGLYVREEIEQENLVRSPEVFSRFLKLAAGESGGLLNAGKLAKQIGASLKTVQRFYEVLTSTRLAFFLSPFTHGRLRGEIIQTPKYYWFDNGVRNAAAARPLDRSLNEIEGGLLFEHLMIQEAHKVVSAYSRPSKPVTCHFWKAHNGKEIDLVLVKSGHEVAQYEFKYTKAINDKYFDGFRKYDELVNKNKFKITKRAVVAPVARNQKHGAMSVICVNEYLKSLMDFVTS